MLNQLPVGDRLEGDGLLHQTEEELAAVPGPSGAWTCLVFVLVNVGLAAPVAAQEGWYATVEGGLVSPARFDQRGMNQDPTCCRLKRIS